MKKMVTLFSLLVLCFEVQASCLTLINESLREKFAKKSILAQNSHIQVIGTSRVKNFAKGILQRTERFDQYMLNLGFKLPQETKIYIDQASLLGRFLGPYYMQEIKNVFTGKTFAKIQLSHYGLPNNQILKLKSVLHHERTHALLHNSYIDKAYVNLDPALQEGLADFFSAFYNKTPIVGHNLHQNSSSLRNILTREFSHNNRALLIMDDIADQTEIFHHYSLHYSNFLWKLQQKIGEKKMAQIVKPILDDLNSYHESYAKVLKVAAPPNRINYNKENYHYFLASIESTLKNYPEIQDELSSLLALTKIENKIDPEFYQKVQNGLAKSTKDYVNYQTPLSRFVTLRGPATIVTAGVVLPTSLFIFISNDIKKQRREVEKRLKK